MKGTTHGHQIHPISLYIKTFLALVVLMAMTIIAAQAPYWMPGTPTSNFLINTAAGSWIMNGVALLIATCKALLVINFFMGVKYASSLVKLWAMTGFVWFSLMFIMFVDYGTRRFEPAPTWNVHDTGTAMNRTIEPQVGSEERKTGTENTEVTIRPRQ